jgi:acetylglutamate kinase
MEKVIEKARVLIEALPYIQRFRGQIVVVKFGGSAMENEEHARGVLYDITFMECVGMRPVIVHGGGKAISRVMKEKGIESRFVKGLRVTCEKSIDVVEQVMNNEINPNIVEQLTGMGAHARGMHGQDIFRARRKVERDTETGAELDLGLVGDPVEVDTRPVLDCIDEDVIPVITPLGTGEDGLTHNMNADTAAAALAATLKAAKLVYLTDVPGLLRDPADESSVLSTLNVDEVEELVRQGVIDGGMLPKIDSGVQALLAGVNKIHMIDGRMDHSLLLEIFTDKGVGTEIVKQSEG